MDIDENGSTVMNGLRA